MQAWISSHDDLLLWEGYGLLTQAGADECLPTRIFTCGCLDSTAQLCSSMLVVSVLQQAIWDVIFSGKHRWSLVCPTQITYWLENFVEQPINSSAAIGHLAACFKEGFWPVVPRYAYVWRLFDLRLPVCMLRAKHGKSSLWGMHFSTAEPFMW